MIKNQVRYTFGFSFPNWHHTISYVGNFSLKPQWELRFSPVTWNVTWLSVAILSPLALTVCVHHSMNAGSVFLNLKSSENLICLAGDRLCIRMHRVWLAVTNQVTLYMWFPLSVAVEGAAEVEGESWAKWNIDQLLHVCWSKKKFSDRTKESLPKNNCYSSMFGNRTSLQTSLFWYDSDYSICREGLIIPP